MVHQNDDPAIIARKPPTTFGSKCFPDWSLIYWIAISGVHAAQFSLPLPKLLPPDPFEGVHNVEQIIVSGPPAGEYLVEVRGGRFRDNAFNQFPGQPFSLVFVGSGQEIRYGGMGGGALPVY